MVIYYEFRGNLLGGGEGGEHGSGGGERGSDAILKGLSLIEAERGGGEGRERRTRMFGLFTERLESGIL